MHPDDKTPNTHPLMVARGWESAQESFDTPIEQPSQPERWETVDRIVFRSILALVALIAIAWGIVVPAVIYGPSVIPTALFPVGLILACIGAALVSDNRDNPKP